MHVYVKTSTQTSGTSLLKIDLATGNLKLITSCSSQRQTFPVLKGKFYNYGGTKEMEMELWLVLMLMCIQLTHTPPPSFSNFDFPFPSTYISQDPCVIFSSFKIASGFYYFQ